MLQSSPNANKTDTYDSPFCENRDTLNAMKRIALLLLALCPLTLGIAAPFDENAALWANILSVHQIKDTKYYTQLAAQLRLIDAGPVYDEGILTGGLGYQVGPTVRAWIGYSFLPTYEDKVGTLQYESRFWEQINWVLVNNASWHLMSRTRLEQRDDLDESGLNVRLRELISVTLFPKQRVSPAFFDEIFFHATHPSWVNKQVLDQNRLFIGINVHIKKGQTLQIGYLNRYKNLNQGGIMDHALFINWMRNT